MYECTDCDGESRCAKDWFEGTSYYFQYCDEFDSWYDCYANGNCTADDYSDDSSDEEECEAAFADVVEWSEV